MNDPYFNEILDLALELFEDTYGLDLDDAFVQARALYPAFQAYAAEWDAESARIAQAEREAWYAIVYENESSDHPFRSLRGLVYTENDAIPF